MEIREDEVRRFHYREGIFFARMKDGGVRVDAPHASFIVDPHSWASVVASMSAGGEDAKSYEQARDFHGCPELSKS